MSADMTHEEGNKTAVQRYLDEVYVRGNIEFVRELFVPGSLLAGAVESGARTMQPAYSDLQVTIDDLIAEGDNVVARVTFTGTHSGPLLGYAATGKQAVLTGLYLFKFADGRVRTMMFEADFYGLLVNLGLIPIPGVQEA
jgi:predicted ester cyclase